MDGTSPEPKRRSLGPLNNGTQQPQQQLLSQSYHQQPSLTSVSNLQQSLLSSFQQQPSFAPANNNQPQSLLTTYQQQLQQPNSYYLSPPAATAYSPNPTFFFMPPQAQQTSTALGWPYDAMATYFTAPTLWMLILGMELGTFFYIYMQESKVKQV